MKILVTGGAGYLGGQLVWSLFRNHHQVMVVDPLFEKRRDLLPPSVQGISCFDFELPHSFSFDDFEACFLLGAESSVPESTSRPEDFFQRNVLGLAQVLTRLKHFKGLTVFASSGSIYAVDTRSTKGCIETGPFNPTNPYSQTKLAGEFLFHSLPHVGSRVILRYFNPIGATDDWGPIDLHHPSLVPSLLRSLRSGHSFQMTTGWQTPDGTPYRDFFPLKDWTQVHLDMLSLYQHWPRDLCLNVGSGIPLSLRQVVSSFNKVTGNRLRVLEQHIPRPGDFLGMFADVENLKKYLGWVPSFDCTKAFEDTLVWSQKIWG